MAPLSTVPILVHDDRVIQGSGTIITYLDKNFPERGLTPEIERLKKDALAWEKYVDNEIGIHIRRCCYHILFAHPDMAMRFFSQDIPWYGKLFLTLAFPELKMKMQDRMNINAESAQISREHLGMAIDRIHPHLKEHEFLTGG